MSRRFCVALLVGLAVSLAGAGNSRGAALSRQNPFRSYNISGINYGSQQWEKQHRKSNYQRGMRSLRRR